MNESSKSVNRRTAWTSEQVADLAEEVRSLATRAQGVDLTSVDTDALRRELASRSALPRRSPSENGSRGR